MGPWFNMHGWKEPLTKDGVILGYVFPGGLTESTNEWLVSLGYKMPDLPKFP